LRNQFGWDKTKNPFVSPNGAIFNRSWDFIMARLTIVSTTDATIEIDTASIVDKNNVQKAWQYDRDTFGQYVMELTSNDQLSSESRIRVVNWWLPPSNNFQIKAGKHEYILAFMGKHPVPDALVANLKIFVNGKENDFNNIPVPEQEN
jgi:hypothetical protein